MKGRCVVAKALNVARKFIHLNNKEKEPSTLTSIKMQILLYYAFGTHLVLHGEHLFRDKITVCRNGIIIDEVYKQYLIYKYFHIKEDDLWYLDYDLIEKEEKTIDFIWNELGKLPLHLLIQMFTNEFIYKEVWGSKDKTLYPDKIRDFFERNYVERK